MAYVMRHTLGEPETVETLERANEICAKFERVVGLLIRAIEEAESVGDRVFSDFDQLSGYWNHNVAVIERMKVDPQLQLREKKARYTKLATSMHQMAKTCAEPPPETKKS